MVGGVYSEAAEDCDAQWLSYQLSFLFPPLPIGVFAAPGLSLSPLSSQ